MGQHRVTFSYLSFDCRITEGGDYGLLWSTWGRWGCLGFSGLILSNTLIDFLGLCSCSNSGEKVVLHIKSYLGGSARSIIRENINSHFFFKRDGFPHRSRRRGSLTLYLIFLLILSLRCIGRDWIASLVLHLHNKFLHGQVLIRDAFHVRCHGSYFPLWVE